MNIDDDDDGGKKSIVCASFVVQFHSCTISLFTFFSVLPRTRSHSHSRSLHRTIVQNSPIVKNVNSLLTIQCSKNKIIKQSKNIKLIRFLFVFSYVSNVDACLLGGSHPLIRSLDRIRNRQMRRIIKEKKMLLAIQIMNSETFNDKSID